MRHIAPGNGVIQVDKEEHRSNSFQDEHGSSLTCVSEGLLRGPHLKLNAKPNELGIVFQGGGL
jgi:hypothetical protein